ncbi:unnamed protein product [Phaeothamnion confervicola]
MRQIPASTRQMEKKPLLRSAALPVYNSSIQTGITTMLFPFSHAARRSDVARASAFSLSIVLAKNIVGAGILPVPHAAAIFSATPTLAAMIIVAVIVVLTGAVCSYCFVALGVVCNVTGAQTYDESWRMTVGPRSGWLPALCCALRPFVSLWMFSIVIGKRLFDLTSTSREGCLPSGKRADATSFCPLLCLYSFPGEDANPAAFISRASLAKTPTLRRQFLYLMAPGCCIVATTLGVVAADSLSSALAGAGAPAWMCHRTINLVVVSIFLLLPLCLLPTLQALSYPSFLGLVAMLYVLWFMAYRYYDGSYLPTGRFGQEVPVGDDYIGGGGGGGGGSWNPSGLLLLFNCLGTAYMCHYNAPKVYLELKDRSVPRFAAVAVAAFTFSAALYAATAVVAWLSFGAATKDSFLDNYNNRDPLATAAQAMVGVTTIFTYPLLLVGTRDGLLGLAQVKEPSRATFVLLTASILAAATLLAVVVRDLTFVAALGGALLSSAIIYILPQIMHLRLLEGRRPAKRVLGERGPVKYGSGRARDLAVLTCAPDYAAVRPARVYTAIQPSPEESRVREGLPAKHARLLISMSWAVLIFGVVLGVAGAVVSILQSFTSVFERTGSH